MHRPRKAEERGRGASSGGADPPVLWPLVPAGGEEALVAERRTFGFVRSQAAIHNIEEHLPMKARWLAAQLMPGTMWNFRRRHSDHDSDPSARGSSHSRDDGAIVCTRRTIHTLT